jgi:peroxiredoxin
VQDFVHRQVGNGGYRMRLERQSAMTRLQNGQVFPAFDVLAVGGGAISITQSLKGSYGVVLIYRGAWCPYCQAQLAGFQRASERLAAAGIKIVAFSVDDEATTMGTIEKFKLSFLVGHSADAGKVASITGAYTNESPRYLQSTGFLLAPDGKILNAVYSSGAIGRLVAEDVIGMVTYLKSKT